MRIPELVVCQNTAYRSQQPSTHGVGHPIAIAVDCSQVRNDPQNCCRLIDYAAATQSNSATDIPNLVDGSFWLRQSLGKSSSHCKVIYGIPQAFPAAEGLHLRCMEQTNQSQPFSRSTSLALSSIPQRFQYLARFDPAWPTWLD